MAENTPIPSTYTYEEIKEIADYLLARTTHVPKIGIIFGTGLGGVADLLQDSKSFSYSEIPKFPVSTVAGHAGRLIFGKIADVPVVCMQGRIHHYEGHPLWKCAMPVRVMKLLGCSHLIVSNAAGALNPEYKVGDVMIIKDHVNFIFASGPLHGPNDERFGPRFPSLYDAYDPALIEVGKTVAKDLKMDFIREGVYIAVGGPNFETFAEMKLLRALGNDAVGMSTVHEVIVARHSDLKVFGFSLISDTMEHGEVSHETNVAVGVMRGPILQKFVEKMVAHIGANEL